MNQHLQQIQGSPKNPFTWSKPKKHFDKNMIQARLLGKEYKNNNTNKNKKSKNLDFQEIKNQDKEPIFTIALNYGVKNGMNQVLHEYTSIPPQGKAKEIVLNSFQKIMNRHRKSRNFSQQSKRLTFVNFKKTQKDIFFTATDFKSLGSKQQRKRAKTEPASNTEGFQRTSFPKQLTDLKQQIRDLIISKKNRKRPMITLPTTTYPQQFNVSSLTNKLNQTVMNSQISHFGDNTYEKRQLFKGSKCQSIKDYIQQINQVITYADEVMHEQDKLEFIDQLELNQFNRGRDPKKLTYYRKYWPQYKRYTMNLRKQGEDKEAAKFFNSFSQSDLRLDDDLQSLVNTIKMDLNNQQQQMNKQIAKSQKNAIQQRFKYKIDIERQNYRRNIKSFIKCKKQYKIQRRREQVRANGIIRLKKATKPQKLTKPVQDKEQQN